MFTRLAALPPFVTAGLLLAAFDPAWAQISLSGFGTVGAAVSDKPYAYQRFVDRQGTFDRDSLFGLQADVRLGEQFSWVTQAKLSPSSRHDDRWDPTLTWAFLAWRPDNDFLLRLGKIRIPYYLNSANLDVGVTYTPAQLPPELYSISSTNETNGLAFSQSWTTAGTDLTLDGYWGVSTAYRRFFLRDGVAALGGPPRGASFIPTRINSQGLALSLARNDSILRFGVHRADVSRKDGSVFRSDFPFVSLAPGLGFYLADPSASAPGVMVPSVRSIHFNIFTAGFDIGLAGDYRLSGEYARRANVNARRGGADTQGAYLALQKKIGAWTPYASLSRLISENPSLDLYQAVNANRVIAPPLTAGQAAAINTSQRFAADRLVVYDQTTLALGTAYGLTPTQKIKAEWAVTRVGKVSGFVDAPLGADVGHTLINVVSVSYNFTF